MEKILKYVLGLGWGNGNQDGAVGMEVSPFEGLVDGARPVSKLLGIGNSSDPIIVTPTALVGLTLLHKQSQQTLTSSLTSFNIIKGSRAVQAS